MVSRGRLQRALRAAWAWRQRAVRYRAQVRALTRQVRPHRTLEGQRRYHVRELDAVCERLNRQVLAPYLLDPEDRRMAAHGHPIHERAEAHLAHLASLPDREAALRDTLTQINENFRQGLLADRALFEADPQDYVRTYHERSDAALAECDAAAALIDQTVQALCKK